MPGDESERAGAYYSEEEGSRESVGQGPEEDCYSGGSHERCCKYHQLQCQCRTEGDGEGRFRFTKQSCRQAEACEHHEKVGKCDREHCLPELRGSEEPREDGDRQEGEGVLDGDHAAHQHRPAREGRA